MRVAWRHLSAIGRAGGLDPEAVWRLGESVFALLDEIIELIGAGFRETGGPPPETERSHRQDLLLRLLSDRESDHRGVAMAASRAGWTMPERVCVVVLDRTADRDGWTLPVAHPPPILSDLSGAVPCLLVPDPGRWDWLPKVAGTCRGCRMVIGPAVGVLRVARSLEQALEMRDLVRSGLVPARPVVSCDDHLRALLLVRNRGLVKQLAEKTLAPLEGLGPKKRARCRATLLAWPKARGNLAEVAGLLRLHSQTVRYRMKELHRLFGERLGDAGFRLDLQLVLRAMDALYAGHAGGDTEPPRLRQVLREHGIGDLIDDHHEQPLALPTGQVVSVPGG